MDKTAFRLCSSLGQCGMDFYCLHWPRTAGQAMKHTPGPWTTTPCSSGGLVVNRGDSFTNSFQIYPEADARLIAAAPELLEALKAFVKAWDKSHQLEKTDVAFRMARAAIRKAEGEE